MIARALLFGLAASLVIAPAPSPVPPLASALAQDAAAAPVVAGAPNIIAAPASAQPDPADGDDARFDSDAALAPHAEDVVDYELRASLDPQRHTLHGEGTIRWTNKSRVAVRELWLHLYLNAFKNQRSTFLTEPIGGFRGSEPVNDWGAIDVQRLVLRGAGNTTDDLWGHAELRRAGSEDETDARVPLPRDVAPNETITLDVAWDDKIPSVVERT